MRTMRITSILKSVTLSMLFAVAACDQDGNGRLVNTIEEFDEAVASLQPGDRIILANGVWTDVELKLSADGLADSPIELTAEEPGKVIISGQSNLGISGSHILVSGLVFKDGYTPTSEVISFFEPRKTIWRTTPG